jgi:hypothetical protein
LGKIIFGKYGKKGFFVIMNFVVILLHFLVNLTIAGIWYNIQDASRGRKIIIGTGIFCGISAFLERIHGERE